MSKRFLFLTILLITTLGIISYKITHAFFSDTASSTENIFAAATLFPTPTPSIANHLVINEVLYDTSTSQNISGQGGSNRGEFVEIYNPTGSTVDLTGWIIEDNSATSGAELLSGTLSSNSFLIITGATSTEFQAIWTVPGGTFFVQADNGTIGNGLANGGDTIVLKNNVGTIVDKMSWGTDTSGFSTGCSGSCPTVLTGHSLERDPDGTDIDNSGDFIDRLTPAPGS